jgi:uncharacterized protein (TIGR02145 family)
MGTADSVTVTVNGEMTLTANFHHQAFTDSRNGRTYKVVKIGTQTWMAENLTYQTADSSWCYENDNSKCNTYGRLYAWNAARTACPSGWHLPSRAEWEELVTFAGGSSTAGRYLKSTGGWYNNGNGTDTYGFSALSGGYRNTGGGFYDAGYYGGWWVATEGGGGNAYGLGMYYGYDSVDEYYVNKGDGWSVRCLMD